MEEPLFPAWFDNCLRMLAVLLALGALLGVLAVALAARSDPVRHTGEPVEQPVQFSHRHHVAEIGLDCRYCHGHAERGAQAGVPASSVCMTCHSQLFVDSAILQPVRDSYAQDRPLHWKKVHDLPDYVYFDHSIHVHKGVACVTCHGRVDQMALVRQVAPLTMGWCLDCHRNPAPHLRPRDQIYSMEEYGGGGKTPLTLPPQNGDQYTYGGGGKTPLTLPPQVGDQYTYGGDGAALMRHYHIRGKELTDCATCHR